MDVAGKEYELSSESDDESDDDEYEKLRKSNDLIPCTVIVPLANLPASTNIWCMFHAQYSCPRCDYKNPLDFVPDSESGKDVFKLIVKVKCDTSFESSAQALLIPLRKNRANSCQELP